jgi:DNA-binding MarR family transcriptional regulator
MKDSTKHHPSDKNAYRFLLLILAALDRSSASKPEELTVLIGQLAALHSKGQTPPIDDPINMYRVLYFLRRKESPKMSEFARALSVSLSTATRMADVLVDNGYAERLSDPKDHRLVRLNLTDYGRKAHDVIEDFLLQDIRMSLNFLTAEEQSILLTLVDKVTAGLKKDTARHK